jgi:hypothetical protein
VIYEENIAVLAKQNCLPKGLGLQCKLRCMFLFAVMWFIFNLHRRNIFLFDSEHTYITCYNIQNMHEFIMKEKEKNIPWHGGSLYMAANSHPCWSIVQSQLPHLEPPTVEQYTI